ncbi:MAG: DUF4294 domain-containing protein [Bacteroidia bacterium]|nr:DUF4294 domain-containing protein [Bacteroidia bacterium]
MKYILIICLIGIQSLCYTQESVSNRRVNGEIMTIYVTEEGDTLLLANLEEVTITAPRKFKNREEQRKYFRYKRYALKVYPYAVKAIKIFREVEMATLTMSKRKRRKYIKKLQKEYEKDFKEPLKKLTRTQGKILIKMIEKELNNNFYDLLKGLRGGFNARVWHTAGKVYGYNLKDGYTKGEDPLMDNVLQDLNISYDINN